MSIQKLKNGKYKAVLWKNNRRGEIKTFSRKMDAEKWQDNKKAKYSDSEVNKVDLDFQSVAAEWLEKYARVNKEVSSVIKDEQMIRQYLNPNFGIMKLRRIAREAVENFICVTRRNTKLSNASINRITALMKKIFNDAISWGYAEINPVNAIKKLRETEKGFDYWSEGEVAIFLDYARNNSNYYLIYKVTLNTGLRLGEVIALKWDAIDFNSRLMRISRTYCGKERRIKETTKSNCIRYVGINDTIFKDIEELYLSRSSDLLFFNQESDLENHYYYLTKYGIKHDAKKAGVKIIRFHDLRHTFASHYAMNGGNLYDLQKILGHSTTKMTERYAHLSPNHLKEKMETVSFGREKIDKSKVISVNFAAKQ